MAQGPGPAPPCMAPAHQLGCGHPSPQQGRAGSWVNAVAAPSTFRRWGDMESSQGGVSAGLRAKQRCVLLILMAPSPFLWVSYACLADGFGKSPPELGYSLVKEPLLGSIAIVRSRLRLLGHLHQVQVQESTWWVCSLICPGKPGWYLKLMLLKHGNAPCSIHTEEKTLERGFCKQSECQNVPEPAEV